MIVNKSMYPLQTGFGVISKMQDKFATLQMQLGTGEKASKLSEMGRDLPLSLSVRSRLGTIEGYSASIDTVNLRLSFLDKTMSRFDKMEGEARNAAVPGQYGTNGINMATLPGLSQARFDEVVTMLNEDVAGRYLFGGQKTDRAPLPSSTTLLKGENGKGGFEAAVDVRGDADGITDTYNAVDPQLNDERVGPGRTALALGGSAVTLSEDGNKKHTFGFKLSTHSTTAASGSVTFTPSAAGVVPKSLAVDFASQPSAGDSISLGFTLPDGTETQIRLTATTETPPPAGSSTIGATPEDTAGNFRTALGGAMERTAQTELRAASVFAAADDFFHESGKAQVPTTSAGAAKPDGLAEDTANSVQWYSGTVAGAGQSARQSVSAAVDDTTRVNYGMEATESGFLALVRSQAALAVSSYKSEETVRGSFKDDLTAAMNKPEGTERTDALAAYEKDVQDAYRLQTGFFDGMASRQQSALSEGHNTEPGSIEIVTMDIGIAKKALENATERHKSYRGQLENLLSDIETVSKEDVAMEIMALQTRLQASYQATPMVSKLSLVSFI